MVFVPLYSIGLSNLQYYPDAVTSVDIVSEFLRQSLVGTIVVLLAWLYLRWFATTGLRLLLFSRDQSHEEICRILGIFFLLFLPVVVVFILQVSRVLIRHQLSREYGNMPVNESGLLLRALDIATSPILAAVFQALHVALTFAALVALIQFIKIRTGSGWVKASVFSIVSIILPVGFFNYVTQIVI